MTSDTTDDNTKDDCQNEPKEKISKDDSDNKTKEIKSDENTKTVVSIDDSNTNDVQQNTSEKEVKEHEEDTITKEGEGKGEGIVLRNKNLLAGMMPASRFRESQVTVPSLTSDGIVVIVFILPCESWI